MIRRPSIVMIFLIFTLFCLYVPPCWGVCTWTMKHWWKLFQNYHAEKKKSAIFLGFRWKQQHLNRKISYTRKKSHTGPMVKNILHYIDTEIEKHIVSRHTSIITAEHWAELKMQHKPRLSSPNLTLKHGLFFSISTECTHKHTNNYSQVHYLATRYRQMQMQRRAPTSVFTHEVKHLLIRNARWNMSATPPTPLMAPSPAMLGSLPVNSTKSPHSF